MKVLVRAPNWVGDQVLAYPFFHYLRRAYPKARIVSACVPWVASLQFRNLIDDVYVLPRPAGEGLRAKFEAIEAAAAALRGEKFDLALSLPNSMSAAWLLFRSGAARRRGYKVDARGLLLNEGLAWDDSPDRHRAQAYTDLLPLEARPKRAAREFWGTPPENDLDAGEPGELLLLDAQAAWPGVEQVEPPAEPYWVMAPGATADSRRWPREYFAQLARRVGAEGKLTGVVVGGPSEAVLAERLCAELHDVGVRVLDRTAQGPVAGLWKLFRGARFTVTNESGLAHLASLCGSFTQIVCGAADPRRTRPLGPGKVQVAINPIECWPCERNTCSQPLGSQLACLKGIQPERVWEEIKVGIGSA